MAPPATVWGGNSLGVCLAPRFPSLTFLRSLFLCTFPQPRFSQSSSRLALVPPCVVRETIVHSSFTSKIFLLRGLSSRVGKCTVMVVRGRAVARPRLSLPAFSPCAPVSREPRRLPYVPHCARPRGASLALGHVSLDACRPKLAALTRTYLRYVSTHQPRDADVRLCRCQLPVQGCGMRPTRIVLASSRTSMASSCMSTGTLPPDPQGDRVGEAAAEARRSRRGQGQWTLLPFFFSLII